MVEPQAQSFPISSSYCKHWTKIDGIWPPLRELISNLLDEVYSSLKIKFNLPSSRLRRNLSVVGKEYKYSFYFDHEGNQIDLLSDITYNSQNQTLKLRNPGKIERVCLIIGNTSKVGENNKQVNPDLIGQFGEGLKVAIITLLQSGRQIDILNKTFTGNISWAFQLGYFDNTEIINYFEKKEDSLTPGGQDDEEEEEVIITISKIAEDEWVKIATDHILILADGVQLRSILSYDISIGQVLLGNKFAGKFYIKGILIKDYSKDLKSEKLLCGLNFFEMKLDRDRNAASSLEERNQKAAQLFADILNNYDKMEIPATICKNKKQFLLVVNSMLEKDSDWTDKLDNYCRQEIKNYFYDIFMESSDPQDGKSMLYPIKSYEDQTTKQKLKTYGLSIEFYQYKTVSYSSMKILKCAGQYMSLDEKIQKTLKEKKIYDGPINSEHMAEIHWAEQQLNVVDPEKPKHSIKFKDFDQNQWCLKEENTYYVSQQLLITSTKKKELAHKIFCVVVDSLQIKSSDIVARLKVFEL